VTSKEYSIWRALNQFSARLIEICFLVVQVMMVMMMVVMNKIFIDAVVL